MRKLFYDLLAGYAPLTALISVGKMFERGAVEAALPAEPPFLIYTFTNVNSEPRAISGVQVWVYDVRGDYSRIEAVLRTIRTRLSDFPEQSRIRSDGSIVRLMQADWQGDSGDLFDDVFRCNTRNGTWRLIGSGQ